MNVLDSISHNKENDNSKASANVLSSFFFTVFDRGNRNTQGGVGSSNLGV